MAPAAVQLFKPQRRIATEAVRQHVEQVAFLWGQRDAWSLDDPPDEAVMTEIAQRVEINLDGLRIAGGAAWPVADRQLRDYPEKGEFFVAGWIAIELNDSTRVDQTVALAKAANERRGLVGALAWHRPERIGHLVRDWLGNADAFKRYLAIGACIEHGVDPKQMLARLVKDPDAAARAFALRLAGKLKRTDLARDMAAALEAEDESVRLWAGWALAELGSSNLAQSELRKATTADGPDALFALRAAIKAESEKEARAWLGGLMRTTDTAPLAVRGIGMLGDRSVLPWLIERMREPHLAVAARAAFLELFPEARDETKLFTADPTELGPAFEKHFEDEVVNVAIPDRVEAWRSE